MVLQVSDQMKEGNNFVFTLLILYSGYHSTPVHSKKKKKDENIVFLMYLKIII